MQMCRSGREPNILTEPLAGLNRPAATFSSVLFPAPFGPTMAICSPCAAWNVISSKALTAASRFPMLRADEA